MTTEQRLLSAVLAAPADDLPRLAYADFFDDAGDAARAEFIRTQCELARGVTDVALQSRERILLAAHADRWLAPLRVKGGPLQNRGTHGQFRRGFVEVVWTPAEVYLAKGEKLFAMAPVQELRVTRVGAADLKMLFEGLRPGRPAVLDLSDRRLGNAIVPLLETCPRAAALEGLRVRGCGITDAGAYRLADLDYDWRPRELDVSFNELTPQGVVALRGRFGGAVRCEAPTGA